MKVFFKVKCFVTGGIFFALSAICHGQQNNIIIGKRVSPKGIVSFSASSALTEISNTKHIDGYVKKYGNTAFTFPVGDNGVYRPFAAAADGTTGAYFQENPNTSTTPEGSPFSISSKDSNLGKISDTEFWDIEGTNTTKITLSWNAASNISALTGNTLTALTIVGWNANTSKWEKIISAVDNSSITGSASTFSSGSITTSSAILPNTYSAYALGANSSGPLPVTLLSFNASLDDSKKVQLAWITTSETNSQQFDLEHSQDAKSWNLLGSVEAKGESSVKVSYSFTDQAPADGENLYRIKMIDKDGSFAYSRIQSIVLSKSEEMVLYPNPVSDKLYVNLGSKAAITEVTFYDKSGSKLLSSKSIGNTGIDIKNLVPGMYLVNIILSDGTSRSNKIIVTR